MPQKRKIDIRLQYSYMHKIYVFVCARIFSPSQPPMREPLTNSFMRSSILTLHDMCDSYLSNACPSARRHHHLSLRRSIKQILANKYNKNVKSSVLMVFGKVYVHART